ncbi:diguanylate cyclase, partial [Stenotrophomonas sp. GbtcB23]|uniref:diguanylate cyclase n=1 Tax=Stenotrophomonas sp. GbtcB23 TaxID=2824768 RepID=UPI001C30EBFF
ATPDPDAAAAAAIAERLRGIIESQPFALKAAGLMLNITASLGIACNTHGAETPEQLLKQADRALYEAKNSGRNRVVAAAA